MKNITGIELAKRIRKDSNRAEIVFITSHFEFAGEGYEVDALHYLIKPISPDKLAQVLTKATENAPNANKAAWFNLPMYDYDGNGDQIDAFICRETFAAAFADTAATDHGIFILGTGIDHLCIIIITERTFHRISSFSLHSSHIVTV